VASEFAVYAMKNEHHGVNISLHNTIKQPIMPETWQPTFTLGSLSSEQFGTECTAHDLEELLWDKFVSLDLSDLILAFTDGTLTSQLGWSLTKGYIFDYKQYRVNGEG
jgi:hypothetical protein